MEEVYVKINPTGKKEMLMNISYTYSNNKEELPDDWWVASHKKRIARKRGEWRDATQWKSNLSSPEARMEHITNIPVHISHKNSTKISRNYA